MKKLTKSNEEYLKSNRNKTIEELCKDTGLSKTIIESFLESLPKKLTRTESLFGRNNRGSVVMTEAASQTGDEKPKIKPTPSHIHKIK